ncbi:MAG: hypothetical protein N2444_05170, partial [Methylocystis sp.]|nr:hypothetical protein [Methylocystis sp.]
MSDLTKPEPPQKLAILEELHRALDFGFQGASDRQRDLLSYLVTEELEGRGKRLKAYSIATDALGRGADFDPQQDSIVRVEIGRLRQTLERYYLDKGKDAAIVINIPKGQYRPVFTVREALPPVSPALETQTAPSPSAKLRQPWLFASLIALGLLLGLVAGAYFWGQNGLSLAPKGRGPVIAIAPFEFHADKEGQAYVGAGLQLELADTLSQFQWLSVVPLKDDITPGVQSAEMTQPDFIMRASLRLIGETLATTALLLDGRTGAVRWTNRYSLPLRADDVVAMQRDLVTKIGRDVGNPFGIVADITRAERALKEPRSDDAFDCQLRAFQYWKTLHSKDYAPAWRCFERLAAQDADANSIAMRALLTLDPLNLPLTKRTVKEAREAALALARLAYERNNFEFIPRAARYITAQCAGDMETFTEIARDTAARFPNNPIALADVGARL